MKVFYEFILVFSFIQFFVLRIPVVKDLIRRTFFIFLILILLRIHNLNDERTTVRSCISKILNSFHLLVSRFNFALRRSLHRTVDFLPEVILNFTFFFADTFIRKKNRSNVRFAGKDSASSELWPFIKPSTTRRCRINAKFATKLSINVQI